MSYPPNFRMTLMALTMPPEEFDRHSKRERLMKGEDSEHMTPAENAYVRQMWNKEQQMEVLVKDLIYGHKKGGPFRERKATKEDYKPAFDFLNELQKELRKPHDCEVESDICSFAMLSTVYEEYVTFLKVHSLVIVISDRFENYFLMFEPLKVR